MRLIQKSPLVVQSNKYSPLQIVEAFEQAYKHLANFDSKHDRSKYLSKLIKTTQKIMEEKMTDRLQGGTAHRSIYQTLTHNAVVKD
jgi:hypothetical protein